MSEPLPTEAETALAQMVAIWGYGEAAKHDPVLVNMLARNAAHLNRIAPGAVEKVRAAFEDMKAQGVSLEKATW
jgi:hypothetical protein